MWLKRLFDSVKLIIYLVMVMVMVMVMVTVMAVPRISATSPDPHSFIHFKLEFARNLCTHNHGSIHYRNSLSGDEYFIGYAIAYGHVYSYRPRSAG